MKNTRSRQALSLEDELKISTFDFDSDKKVLKRLVQVIEEYLPGDFSNWEREHSTWKGPVKTVDATQRDPRALASAWSIHIANKMGEEAFGFADRKKDEDALLQLERALAEGLAALQEISFGTRRSLQNASIQKMSGIALMPADLAFVTCAAALGDGILAARETVESEGTPKSREHRRAAAVVGECREIYAARGYGPAPRSARDEPEPPAWARKDGEGEENTKFVRFAKAVFDVLGIRIRVDSALRIWRDLDDRG